MAAQAWSVSENERFETALAVHGTDDEPGCWARIAADVGGGRTADDVRRHYGQLVVDIHNIEAGGGRPNTNRGGAAGTSSNGSSTRDNRRPQT